MAVGGSGGGLPSSGQISMSDITSEGQGGANSNESLRTWSQIAYNTWWEPSETTSSGSHRMSDFYGARKYEP